MFYVFGADNNVLVEDTTLKAKAVGDQSSEPEQQAEIHSREELHRSSGTSNTHVAGWIPHAV